MSRIEELIEEFCPDGVPYKELGEIGSFYSGLTGKSKSDFQDGNAKFVTYMNVFSNIAVNTNISDYVKIKGGEKQNQLRQGDILFTGSSETPDECGMSSVLTKQTSNDLYLNSFCFGFRLNDEDLLLPNFSKYLFRSDSIRKQIIRTASGVTRFNVSKQKMLKVRIPIPILSVQEEIVRILDTFTKLDAELKIELETRKKQYKYYRDKLLTLDKPTGFKYIDQLVAELCPNGVQFQPIGDFAKCIAGATPKTAISRYWEQGTIPWMSSGEVNKREILDTEAKITEEAYASCSTKLVPANTVVIALAGQGKTRGTVAITRIPLCTNQSLCSVIPNEEVIPDFLFHYLRGQYEQLRQISSGDGTRGGLNLKMINAYRVPVPPIQLQEEIVRILNNLDKLCHDISKGLPAEIEARRKQYEYYRDKLLTFRELEA